MAAPAAHVGPAPSLPGATPPSSLPDPPRRGCPQASPGGSAPPAPICRDSGHACCTVHGGPFRLVSLSDGFRCAVSLRGHQVCWAAARLLVPCASPRRPEQRSHGAWGRSPSRHLPSLGRHVAGVCLHGFLSGSRWESPGPGEGRRDGRRGGAGVLAVTLG